MELRSTSGGVEKDLLVVEKGTCGHSGGWKMHIGSRRVNED